MAGQSTSLRTIALLSLLLMALGPLPAAAQMPTGTLSGRVTDTQGRSVGGAVVTIESPNLQGSERTKTTPNGDYIFKLLPPGPYTVTIDFQGFATATETRDVAGTQVVSVDVTLEPQRVREEVTVVPESYAFTNTMQGAFNVHQALTTTLPTARDLGSAVSLAPAVHATGPSGNFSISGAMSFENLFMVNGVPIQDNLRGNPFNLYIEDAIQETTTTTSGVSAEYGRFSGGIVNVITKSGGNQFSGSFRTAFSNDSWRTTSPFGESKVNKTVPVYEFTAGGPVVKDRLWFFVAGRTVDRKRAHETGYTNIPYTFENHEKRFEGKLTQLLTPSQRVEVSYIGIQQRQTNSAYPSSSGVMDLASLTNPNLPESLMAVHYTGGFGSRFFLEGQSSARRFAFKHDGGLNTDLIAGTTLMDQQTGAYWWAPNFCGVCADEQRNNNDVLLKGICFLSTRARRRP